LTELLAIGLRKPRGGRTQSLVAFGHQSVTPGDQLLFSSFFPVGFSSGYFNQALEGSPIVGIRSARQVPKETLSSSPASHGPQMSQVLTKHTIQLQEIDLFGRQGQDGLDDFFTRIESGAFFLAGLGPRNISVFVVVPIHGVLGSVARRQ
jgi:hypothetical protein